MTGEAVPGGTRAWRGSAGPRYLHHERQVAVRCWGRGRVAADLPPDHKATFCGRLRFSWVEDAETGLTTAPEFLGLGVRHRSRTVFRFKDGRELPWAELFEMDELERPEIVESHSVHTFECRRCQPPLRIDLREIPIDTYSLDLWQMLTGPRVSAIALRDLIAMFSR